MTNTEKLERLADELRPDVDYRLDLAILTLVETLADVGDGHITSTCGNIGISITESSIFLTSLSTGEIILTLNVGIE